MDLSGFIKCGLLVVSLAALVSSSPLASATAKQSASNTSAIAPNATLDDADNFCFSADGFFNIRYYQCPGPKDPAELSSCCRGGRCCTYEEARRQEEESKYGPNDPFAKVVALFVVVLVLVLLLTIFHECWAYCCLRQRLISAGRVIATSNTITVLPEGASLHYPRLQPTYASSPPKYGI